MAAAAGAHHLCPFPSAACILPVLDRALLGVGEAGPAVPGRELGIGVEQFRATRPAAVGAVIRLLQEFTRAGLLGAALTQHVVLLLGQLLLPLVLAPGKLRILSHTGSTWLPRFKPVPVKAAAPHNHLMDADELTIHRDVYPPGDDTAFLSEALQDQDLDGKRVCDMGTGSGILAAQAAAAGAEVVAVDASVAAAENARETLAPYATTTVVRSDLFEAVRGWFDLVVCNPPYTPLEPELGTDREKSYAGGRFGRTLIDRFIVQTPHHLKPGGRVLLLQTVKNGVTPTLNRFHDVGLNADIVATRDVGNATLVIVQAGHR